MSFLYFFVVFYEKYSDFLQVDFECKNSIYTYEIAEQKGTEATNESRDRGFPLQVKIEQE